MVDMLEYHTNKARQDLELQRNFLKAEPFNKDAVAQAVKNAIPHQDRVIDHITDFLYCRLHRTTHNRPVAFFCLAGPKGANKIQIARAFAEVLDRGATVIDMGMFSQPQSADALLGSDGILTNALLDDPDGVFILDEFEKAHIDIIYKILLANVDGYPPVTSTREKVSARDAIFFLTTNAGADDLDEQMEAGKDLSKMNYLDLRGLLERGGFPVGVLPQVDGIVVADRIAAEARS